MLSFLSKVLILGISFKLYASVTEFCYKCDDFCTKPPIIEFCNASIDNNSVCMVRRDPVHKTETRSCLYPSTQSANISACNETDDGLCKVCEGNICNVPVKRKIKGPSRCYYCGGDCKNPMETDDCYFLQNVCYTVIRSEENRIYDHDKQDYVIQTEIAIWRGCGSVEVNQTENSFCDTYNRISNFNCTVCNWSKCNRFPDDPPDPTPRAHLTANFANVFECYRILLEFSIFIVTFIIK